MQKKAKCANSNYFKSESDSTIPFQIQVRVETLNNFSFRKEKNLCDTFKTTPIRIKSKRRWYNWHFQRVFHYLWLKMTVMTLLKHKNDSLIKLLFSREILKMITIHLKHYQFFAHLGLEFLQGKEVSKQRVTDLRQQK